MASWPWWEGSFVLGEGGSEPVPNQWFRTSAELVPEPVPGGGSPLRGREPPEPPRLGTTLGNHPGWRFHEPTCEGRDTSQKLGARCETLAPQASELTEGEAAEIDRVFGVDDAPPRGGLSTSGGAPCLLAGPREPPDTAQEAANRP